MHLLAKSYAALVQMYLMTEKWGSERVWRELLAGILNPPRALNRLTQGKMWRITSKEVLPERTIEYYTECRHSSH